MLMAVRRRGETDECEPGHLADIAAELRNLEDLVGCVRGHSRCVPVCLDSCGIAAGWSSWSSAQQLIFIAVMCADQYLQRCRASAVRGCPYSMYAEETGWIDTASYGCTVRKGPRCMHEM